MKRNSLYILFFVLAAVFATGCQTDLMDVPGNQGNEADTGSTVLLVSEKTGGAVLLAVDAPAQKRASVWLDLDGDGVRAEDGSEEVKVFNSYQSYKLEDGQKTVVVHGDVTYLGAADNGLSKVDVTGNRFLVTLNVPQNSLEAIDVSACTGLKRLDVSGNNLDRIDVGQNRLLESLWVFDNRLSSIDVSANEALVFLDCSGNTLCNLDLSGNTNLVRLVAFNNRLSSLDLSSNTRLSRLWVFGNNLKDEQLVKTVSSLKSVGAGELWLTEETPEEQIIDIVAKKGWSLH